MIDKQYNDQLQELLRQGAEPAPVRITTYLDEDLHEELMRLKDAGISIKKLMNRAVTEFLKRQGIL